MTASSIATKPTPTGQSDQVSLRTWINVAGVLLGAFMAVLDIQITNSSLKDIQGALSASLDEGSWISTAYLVAEIVVIPLTGWLGIVFSKRNYLLVNAALFVVFSVCCAFAWDLNSMIVFRALQGFTGGVLIPMAFTVILTKLPRAKQPVGLALFGITATFAPTIGPTLGGWLTENYGWEYIFYLNVIPGALLIASVWFTMDKEPMQLGLIKQGDWFGILTMAVGLASLEVVLEEGNRKDWFGNDLILRLAIVAAIALTLFFWIEFTSKKPFINLRLLGLRNFGLGAVVNVGLGLGLYGSVYILPLYLAQIQGYNAMQIGVVIMWAGLPQLVIIPLLPKLMQRIDPRWLLGFGCFMFGVSCVMKAYMTSQTGYDQLIWSQLVRAIGQPFIITPLSTIATSEIPPGPEAGSASGLFNMMRNLGGSIGIAVLSTLLTWREQLHSERIGEAISLYAPQTQERLNQLTQFFTSRGADLASAQEQAIKALDTIVRREAYTMGYNDCFFFIGAALILCSAVVVSLKRPKLGAGGGGAH